MVEQLPEIAVLGQKAATLTKIRIGAMAKNFTVVGNSINMRQNGSIDERRKGNSH